MHSDTFARMERPRLLMAWLLVLISLLNFTIASAQELNTRPKGSSTANSPEMLVPKDDSVAPKVEKEDRLGAPTTQYLHISGSVFVPLWETSTRTYAGSGCVYMGGTNMYLNFPVILPDNSTITQLRLYYKDASASAGTLWLTQNNDGLDYVNLAEIATTGSSFAASHVTQDVNVPLDYGNFSYVLQWSPAGVSGSTMQFCGARIGYTRPLFGAVALPIIQKGSQP